MLLVLPPVGREGFAGVAVVGGALFMVHLVLGTIRVQWYNGVMVKWCNGVMLLCCNGVMV